MLLFLVGNIYDPHFGVKSDGDDSVFLYVSLLIVDFIGDFSICLLVPSIIIFYCIKSSIFLFKSSSTINLHYFLIALFTFVNSVYFLSNKSDLYFIFLKTNTSDVLDIIGRNTDDSTILTSNERSEVENDFKTKKIAETKLNIKKENQIVLPHNNVRKAYLIYFSKIGFDTVKYREELLAFKYDRLGSFACIISTFYLTSGLVHEYSFEPKFLSDYLYHDKSIYSFRIIFSCFNFFISFMLLIIYVIFLVFLLFKKPTVKF